MPVVAVSRSLKDRLIWELGEWLAQTRVSRLVLRYDGQAPSGRPRYVNRINGHCLVRW